jgi:uncharacterized protein with von Willebrand factor type A (vWA) domain
VSAGPGAGLEGSSARGQDAAGIAVAFSRVARGVGLEVPVGSVVTLASALAATGVGSERAAYWAGRVTLVKRPDEIPAYEAAFEAFWRRAGTPDEARPATRLVVGVDSEGGAEAGSGEGLPGRPVPALHYSPVEVLRRRDFAQMDADELAETFRLIDRMRSPAPLRRSRRRVATRHGGDRLDVRRTLRLALRTGGVPVHTARSKRASALRPLVLVCDVSGSMEPYSRALLRFVHAAVAGRRKVYAFALGTRLTPISRELSWRDPDAALARAAEAAPDRAGGTRLGAGIAELNSRYGVRGMARGAVVVVLSDGWDRGDPELLGREMERLALVCRRIVWVNPLKSTPGFAPLARGMAAALPHVDELVEGHSLASLESLVEVIAR